ncbi:MAG TPA: hypothetical protein VNA25_08440 [Phycisphaerae bacterium]|nr:hypothetical protein [Phycisphaerae bacterium]
MSKLLWTVGQLALTCGAAFAEVAVDGHEATAIKPQVPWVTIAYAVVAVIAIAAVGFKNAKRTHLD